jgi:hypothetical protein
MCRQQPYSLAKNRCCVNSEGGGGRSAARRTCVGVDEEAVGGRRRRRLLRRRLRGGAAPPAAAGGQPGTVAAAQRRWGPPRGLLCKFSCCSCSCPCHHVPVDACCISGESTPGTANQRSSCTIRCHAYRLRRCRAQPAAFTESAAPAPSCGRVGLHRALPVHRPFPPEGPPAALQRHVQVGHVRGRGATVRCGVAKAQRLPWACGCIQLGCDSDAPFQTRVDVAVKL